MSKFKSALVAFVLVISMSFSISLFAQQGSYSGTEVKLEANTLVVNAENTDFSNSICAKIFEDNKNTYYAVDVSQLTSKFEKIRLLELSYTDKALVSMGSDSDNKYYFFLVNNIFDKSPKDVATIIDGFLAQSTEEEKVLNSEQLRLWLIQHDKY